MKRMRKIKAKMMAGIFLVFQVSFAVLMINIGANQRVVNETQYLLKSNYPSVKYSFHRVLNIQEKVAIAGLTIMCIMILTRPFLVINPIDKLTEKMIMFYKFNFN